jgi:transposase
VEARTAPCRGPQWLRYPSDLTDTEWAIVEPMIPPARHGGCKRSVSVREVLNGIFYILWTGCQWKALPKDLPPKSTVVPSLAALNRGRAVSGDFIRISKTTPEKIFSLGIESTFYDFLNRQPQPRRADGTL